MKIIERFEPKLETLEEEYRQHYLRADADQVFAFSFLVMITNIIFIAIEYWLYFPQQRFYFLQGARITYICLTIFFLIFLKKTKLPKKFDTYTFIWMLGMSFIGVVVWIFHEAEPSAIYAVDVSVTFFFYLIIPITLHYRTISAALITIVSIFGLFVFDHLLIIPHKVTIVIIFLIVNAVGFISSSRIYSYRRNQYNATIKANLLTQELAKLANTDPLTGILNRRKFLELAEGEFQRYLRYHSVFSLAVFDFDHFKKINDQFGHHVGDIALKKLCEVVSSANRQVDKIGRLGGDEFALLLPSTSLSTAVQVVERIRALIENEVILIEDNQIQMTVSVGVTAIIAEDDELNTLLQRSDVLLYEAKRKGSNRVEFKITTEKDNL
ncbi:MAG: diguanylate cyclase [Anaerolineae bacterium]|jgi:diguanylate cyclase (GGDEF)-like protein|nr:diguanylate cyclase [Anaerolineae bacterium]